MFQKTTVKQDYGSWVFQLHLHVERGAVIWSLMTSTTIYSCSGVGKGVTNSQKRCQGLGHRPPKLSGAQWYGGEETKGCLDLWKTIGTKWLEFGWIIAVGGNWVIPKCVSVEKCEMSCLKKPSSLEKLLVFKRASYKWFQFTASFCMQPWTYIEFSSGQERPESEQNKLSTYGCFETAEGSRFLSMKCLKGDGNDEVLS